MRILRERKLFVPVLKPIGDRIVDEWMGSEFTRDLLRNTLMFDLLEELSAPARNVKEEDAHL
jgi:hypothetical protein